MPSSRCEARHLREISSRFSWDATQPPTVESVFLKLFLALLFSHCTRDSHFL
jgi:hypothetical protein